MVLKLNLLLASHIKSSSDLIEAKYSSQVCGFAMSVEALKPLVVGLYGRSCTVYRQ